ncbi:DUF4003 domain-containing protein [Clostridium sardiniense]
MNYEKVQLLVNNSMELDNAGGIFTGNSFRKCNALSLTLKGKNADANRINDAIKIIKDNTSMLSNFRGNNLLTTAITISLESDMEGSFKELMTIYERLKNHFFTNQYLILSSIVIFNARYRVNIDEAVRNTRMVYDYMKKNHRFLTGQEDISAAAMIATTSGNMELTLNEIEECYKALRDNGFGIGNNTQSLSHILPLFSGSVDEKVSRIVKVDEALRDNRVPLRYYSLPILGIAAVIADDPNTFAKEVREVNERIKSEKGFGSFTLGSTIRNMIATGLVASYYVDKLTDTDKQRLIDTTNNVALTIQIAIEIAAASAAAAAGAAAASSSGS